MSTSPAPKPRPSDEEEATWEDYFRSLRAQYPNAARRRFGWDR